MQFMIYQIRFVSLNNICCRVIGNLAISTEEKHPRPQTTSGFILCDLYIVYGFECLREILNFWSINTRVSDAA